MGLFNTSNRFDKLMAAISFAEANEQEIAMSIIKVPQCIKKQRALHKRNEKQQNNRPQLRM